MSYDDEKITSAAEHHVEHAESTTSSELPATRDEEAKIIWKLDLRLMPFVFVLYSLSVLDRSNLGNARLAGLEQDLHLNSSKYNWLGTIFYIAYILFQFTVAGWKQFKAHQWGAFVVFFWGFVATIQATTTSWGGLMTCRFFLGVAEAAFGPGVPLYLSFFYPREKVGFRHGVFISGAAMANVYGSLLAYGITQIRGTLAPWKILFIIEGLPTCCLAVFAWLFLPDSIETSSFLSPREKLVATRMVARGQVLDEGSKKQGVRFDEFFSAFKDPRTYLPAMMYFSVNVSFASLPLFVPTIIKEIGTFPTAQSQGLSAPPYALAFLLILLASYLSDRARMRGPFIMAASLIAAVGFAMLATLTVPAGRYAGVFLAVQIFVCVALLICWIANLSASESRRAAGFVILNGLGQCGPLVGTNIFPESEAPLYRRGMWISFGFCVLVAALAATLSGWLAWENRRWARAGLLVPEGEEEGAVRDDEKPRGEGELRRRNIW